MWFIGPLQLYRLADADNLVQSDEAFTYDNVGNRLTASDSVTEWTYNGNNELTGHDDVTYDYDLNGNMIEKNAGGVITKFFYNVEDRLERVEDGSSNVIASYYYDLFGRRLWKDVSGTRTCFHYSDEGLVGEYDATGSAIKTYGWKPGSTWSTDPLFMKIGGEYYYYHNNHLGTPQKITSVSGAVVWSAKYSSFGEASIDVESVVNNLRFPSQFYDETGMHYNFHRYYDPRLGRYTRSDPIGLDGGINLFAHVQNNPLNQIDPMGLDTHRCSRELGGPYEPATDPERRFRHDYIKAGDAYYSFGSVGDSLEGPGLVSVNTENDYGGKCHLVCDDNNFDVIVAEIAVDYVPRYNIRACESPNKSDTPCVVGERNCKSWTDDVLERAKIKYLDKYGDCAKCFLE